MKAAAPPTFGRWDETHSVEGGRTATASASATAALEFARSRGHGLSASHTHLERLSAGKLVVSQAVAYG